MGEATFLGLGAQVASGLGWAGAVFIWPQHCPSQGLAFIQPTFDQKGFLSPSRVGVSLAGSAVG